jgi:hypothetical protein
MSAPEQRRPGPRERLEAGSHGAPALIEVEASRSTAIKRLGIRLDVNEVLVLFTGSKNVYVYRDVPFDVLEEINKDTSLGKLVSNIKKLCKPVSGTKVFPEGAIKWDPASDRRLPTPKLKPRANPLEERKNGRTTQAIG